MISSKSEKSGVSKAIIFDKDYYLLQLRDNIPTITYPNCWSFFGGEIEDGERPWEALQREIREELNWYPSEGKFLWKYYNASSACQIHFFSLNLLKKKCQIILNEGQEYGWFKINEIEKKRMIMHVVENLRKFEKIKL